MLPESDSPEKVSVEYQLIYLEPPDCRGPMDLSNETEPEHPVEQFLAKCADEQSLAKNGGLAAYLDPTWNTPIGAAPRFEFSKGFLERSDRRFQAVTQKIRAMFPGHDEEVQEMIDVAKAMRDDVRQEFIPA